MNIDAQQRNLLIAGSALLAAFVAGGLAGGAVAVVATGHGPRHAEIEMHALGGPGGPFEFPALPGPPHDDVFFESSHRPFGRALGLSESQQTRVDSLLDEQREKAERIMTQMEPRLKALMDSTNQAIEEILTPDQREEFRRLQRDRRDVIIRRFVGPPGP